MVMLFGDDVECKAGMQNDNLPPTRDIALTMARA
jgi:hypothetical protein